MPCSSRVLLELFWWSLSMLPKGKGDFSCCGAWACSAKGRVTPGSHPGHAACAASECHKCHKCQKCRCQSQHGVSVRARVLRPRDAKPRPPGSTHRNTGLYELHFVIRDNGLTPRPPTQAGFLVRPCREASATSPPRKDLEAHRSQGAPAAPALAQG